jgi:DNA-3-methyladenine glycosylase II
MSDFIHEFLLEKSASEFKDLNGLIRQNGQLTLEPRSGPLFDYMARLAAGQQLSGKAARSIWSRVITASSEEDCDLISFCKEKNFSRLRSCGLSSNKVKALYCLKNALLVAEISEEKLRKADYPGVVQLVERIWGFGPWSADMTALFYCGLPDVWSEGDTSLKKGIDKLSGSDPDRKEYLLACCSPYRSFLALHIWKGIDAGMI